jgi:hypothetical protein
MTHGQLSFPLTGPCSGFFFDDRYNACESDNTHKMFRRGLMMPDIIDHQRPTAKCGQIQY